MRIQDKVQRRISSPKIIGLLLAAACAGLSVSPAYALQITGYSPANNNRFSSGTTANPTFIGASYDLSGIGTGTALSDTAVMISPHYFLSAYHVGHPLNLTFVNTLGQTITKQVERSAPIQYGGVNTDLRIGKLHDDNGITPADHIAYYPMIVQPSSWYIGQKIFVYGQQNQAGINTVAGLQTIYLGGGNASTTLNIRYDFNAYTYGANLNYPNQAGLMGGDSGRNWGIIWNGQYTVGGTHEAISGNTSGFYSSYSTLASNYVNQINAYMTSYGPANEQVTIQSIPEPSGLGVLIGGMALLMRRKPGKC